MPYSPLYDPHDDADYKWDNSVVEHNKMPYDITSGQPLSWLNSSLPKLKMEAEAVVIAKSIKFMDQQMGVSLPYRASPFPSPFRYNPPSIAHPPPALRFIEFYDKYLHESYDDDEDFLSPTCSELADYFPFASPADLANRLLEVAGTSSAEEAQSTSNDVNLPAMPDELLSASYVPLSLETRSELPSRISQRHNSVDDSVNCSPLLLCKERFVRHIMDDLEQGEIPFQNFLKFPVSSNFELASLLFDYFEGVCASVLGSEVADQQ